jgi:hypothetical protein
MDKNDHRALEERARHLYRRAAEQLDSATRVGLVAARERAVDAAGPGSLRGWMLPAAAVAGAAAISLAVMMNARTSADFGTLAAGDPAAEDMDLLLTSENLDMLSDLDFYLWLETEPDDG